MPPAPAAPATSQWVKRSTDRNAAIVERERQRMAASGDTPAPAGPSKADIARMRKADEKQSRPYREEYEREEAERSKAKGDLDEKRAKGRMVNPRAGGRGVTVGGKTAHPSNIVRGKPVVAGGGPVEEGAGVLLGLVAWALLMSYLKYGPDGVRGWFAAKFLNRPYAPAVGDAPASPIPPAPQSNQAKPASAAYPSPRAVLL